MNDYFLRNGVFVSSFIQGAVKDISSNVLQKAKVWLTYFFLQFIPHLRRLLRLGFWFCYPHSHGRPLPFFLLLDAVCLNVKPLLAFIGAVSETMLELRTRKWVDDCFVFVQNEYSKEIYRRDLLTHYHFTLQFIERCYSVYTGDTSGLECLKRSEVLILPPPILSCRIYDMILNRFTFPPSSHPGQHLLFGQKPYCLTRYFLVPSQRLSWRSRQWHSRYWIITIFSTIQCVLPQRWHWTHFLTPQSRLPQNQSCLLVFEKFISILLGNILCTVDFTSQTSKPFFWCWPNASLKPHRLALDSMW